MGHGHKDGEEIDIPALVTLLLLGTHVDEEVVGFVVTGG